ncbi:MAG: hypothetical protein QG604_574 [Candidatus Dependentiae bacterium]|nr:hypothetical protein [Candidatus Dependentiae bacterium]
MLLHIHPLLTTLKTSSTEEYYLLVLCAAICDNTSSSSGGRLSHCAQTIEQPKQLIAKKLINNFFIKFPFP